MLGMVVMQLRHHIDPLQLQHLPLDHLVRAGPVNRQRLPMDNVNTYCKIGNLIPCGNL